MKETGEFFLSVSVQRAWQAFEAFSGVRLLRFHPQVDWRGNVDAWSDQEGRLGDIIPFCAYSETEDCIVFPVVISFCK